MRSTTKCCYSLALLGALISCAAPNRASAQEQSSMTVNPSKLPKLATVDPLYVSYNVEMVEVTGGRFWKPYKSSANAASSARPSAPTGGDQQVGSAAGPYEYRPPINLSDPRLRNLARALGPSYLRVSGSWANSSFFQDNDDPTLKQVPDGFRQVLTRAEWKGVVDFAHATGDKLVTSFAISPGTRDALGLWTPVQAKALIDYTKSIGGSIAAAEFMNEPTFPGPGGAPAGYDAAAFAKDVKVFEPFLRKESPQTIFLGPGGVMEGGPAMYGGMKLIDSNDILKATGPAFDAFSYHFYGGVSRRCGGNMNVEKAMSANWLDQVDGNWKFYANMRDQLMPGKSLWLTETAEAACGGDQLAGEFADSFRFLNQFGTLAQKGVMAIMHNTLASSDYGLLNEDGLEPRPNYWAALLWKRMMGSVVLDPGIPNEQNLRVYAQCMVGHKGGVTFLAMNLDTKREHTLTISLPADRYTLTAPDLTSTSVLLNGVALQARADGTVPEIKGQKVAAGDLQLAPASITFLAVPSARNKSCM